MLGIISKTPLKARLSRVSSGSQFTLLTARHASLNSAIGRGIRRSQTADRDNRRGDDSRFPRRERQTEESQYGARQYGGKKYDRSNSLGYSDQRTYGSKDRSYGDKNSGRSYGSSRKDYGRQESPWNDNNSPFAPRRDRKEEKFEFDADEFIRSGDFRGLPREHQSRFQPRFQSRTQDDPFTPPGRERSATEEPREKKSKSRAHRVTQGAPERVKENVKAPETIPYTTPASEFIYGTSAVEAALRCSRRQLYKLYLYQGVEDDLSAAKITIRKLALSKNIPVKMAFAGWSRLLDKMSAGRPHNGCILEASPLPKLPVRALQAVPSISEEYFRTELAPQTREEAAVNGTDDRIRIHHPSPTPQNPEPRHRYPVILLLDGIVDTGNMGAIIRSSYFLGIDAIVLAGRNSAPLSPITIKSSAGAAENMPLLHVTNEVDFIQRSKQNGWRFYAADAPGPGSVYLDQLSADSEAETNLPIMAAPSVVMMGSEASGLSSHIKSHADAIVSIQGARHSSILGVEADPARIDSLNVSVAAAVLMEKFLQTPLAVSGVIKKEKTPKAKMW